MLFQVLTFLLEVLVTLVGGARLLRLYMHWQRASLSNPVGSLTRALSDWLVLPLRRLIPPRGRMDAASLLAAWVLKLVQYAVIMGLVFGLLQFVTTFAITFIYARWAGRTFDPAAESLGARMDAMSAPKGDQS